MATAPRPGTLRKQAERNKAFVITVDGVPQRLVNSDLGPADARRIRQLRLGFSLAGLQVMMSDPSQIDIDIVCALWWLARVKAGENVTYEQAEAEFPGYAEVQDRASFEIVDDGDEDEVDSPEG